MRNYSIDELANKVAKDVLVAIAPNLSISIDEKGGKQVAEFYSALFNSIADTLGNSYLDVKNSER